MAVRWTVVVALAIATAADVHAQALPDEGTVAAEAPPADEETRRARQAYWSGVRLARQEQWAEALKASEEAAKTKDAAILQYDI